jgi:2-polyprenyl-6-methoxyphenol hydroxylase-like FAD-dependent oxidoreductase
MNTVHIVGGGLAGLTLGLRLRQLGVPVKLFEAGNYPRHRVCGEYLSGRGREFLLSLLPEKTLAHHGARSSTGLKVFRGKHPLPHRSLPRPALCLSRHRLDEILAREFSSAGGCLHPQTRQTPSQGEGWVTATGRQPAVREQGWRWIGLKAHAFAVPLGEDLEMHLTPHGYVGLCAVEENRVNVCGLFRTRETIPNLAHRWKEWLGGAPGSALRQRLEGVRWDENSFSSVSAISLRPRRAAAQEGVRVGDALTMIPPLTGNGMSMAIEGAFLAAEPLAEWSSGKIRWSEGSAKIALALDRAFSSRLRWARLLQQSILHPLGQPLAWNLSHLFPALPRLLFHQTR